MEIRLPAAFRQLLRRGCLGLLLSLGLTVAVGAQLPPAPVVESAPATEAAPAPDVTKPQLSPELEAHIKKLVDERFKEEQQRRDDKTRADAEKKAAEEKAKADEGFEVGKDLQMTAVWNNGILISTKDDSFRFHVGGRVDFDNTWYNQDQNLLLGSTDTTNLRDGSDFRRMRLRVDGRFWENVDFVFEVNFANIQDFSNQTADQQIGSVGLTESHLTFRELPWVGNFRIGHQKPPISLEHLTSSRFIYFMERSPGFDAFNNRFDYANSAMLFNQFWEERATAQIAFMRTGSRTVNPFGSGSGDGEYGFAIRGTILPIASDDGREILHFGLAYMQRALDEQSTSPGDRPLVRGGAGREIPNIMQTGRFFGPEGFHYVNPEVALVLGPFSLSGEYLWSYTPSTYLNRSVDGVYSDPRGAFSSQAFYVESGLFVTPGDYRRYNRQFGAWDRTVPQENAFLLKGDEGGAIFGRGAVQLLARFTYLDLASGTPVITSNAGARAGIEKDITLGVNWYLNPQACIMVNYVRTYIDSVVPGASGSFNGLGIRFHYDF